MTAFTRSVFAASAPPPVAESGPPTTPSEAEVGASDPPTVAASEPPKPEVVGVKPASRGRRGVTGRLFQSVSTFLAL